MKKLILMVFIVSALVFPAKEAKALDAKTKAFLVVAGYGTVGGALLGFASMAFGTNSRAIAQGASLGLYTGIIFGTYVLTSYNTKSDPYENYQEEPPPYYPPGGGYPPPAGGFGAPPPQEDGGFFGSPRRVMEIQQETVQRFENKKGSNLPPIYLNLLNLKF